MFMISVLFVCRCALLNFESFIHGHFFIFLKTLFNMFLFCWVFGCVLGCFFWFFFLGGGVGLLVPLNGIKKYLA